MTVVYDNNAFGENLKADWGFSCLIRGLEKSVRFGVLKFINVAANLSMNVLFVVYLKQGVPGIFKANLIASAWPLNPPPFTFTLISNLPSASTNTNGCLMIIL